jgi:Uma2 family endonuclease
MVAQIKTRMTAAEFFELPESNQFIELLDGELIMSPSPLTRHQRMSGWFFALLLDLIPNGELFYAPMDVYFDDDNVPQPDIMWVAESSKCVITEKRLVGPPDLIVEVLSPGTAANDRKKKFELYQKYGVREYWIADPVHLLLDVWQLVDGAFVWLGAFGTTDTFISPVLGKSVSLDGVLRS